MASFFLSSLTHFQTWLKNNDAVKETWKMQTNWTKNNIQRQQQRHMCVPDRFSRMPRGKFFFLGCSKHQEFFQFSFQSPFMKRYFTEWVQTNGIELNFESCLCVETRKIIKWLVVVNWLKLEMKLIRRAA